MRCLLLFFFLPILTFAQPGGGGGLIIEKIIADEQAEIRAFLMNGYAIHHEILEFIKDKKIYIPSEQDFKQELDVKEANLVRLMISKNKSKMIIDFVDIPGENGMGRKDNMDSLVFMEGYFTYHRKYNSTYNQLMKKGLTKSNLNTLLQHKIVKKQALINDEFLNPKNLPASYHNYKAAYFLKNSELDKAAEELEKAKVKCGIDCCKTNFLLTDYYSKIKDYDKAVNYIDKVMNCRRSVFYTEEDNLYLKAELLIKAGQGKEALKDYDKIIRSSEDPFPAIIQKAYCKSKQLKQSESAISDLEKLLADVPASHFNEVLMACSEYKDIFFALGNVYFDAGNKEKAAENWYKAMLLCYSNHSSANTVELQLDTVLASNPTLSKVYMARAIAKYRRGPYLGWGEETKNVFQSALVDIQKAQELGFNSYEVYMYSALILRELKDKNEALIQINKAIEFDSTDARGYAWRYHIRQDLGKAAWGNKNDPDILMFEKLKKEWVFDPK